jgi:hypothetical protein
VVGTGFKGNINGGIFQKLFIVYRVDRVDFSVGSTGSFMISFANNPVIMYNDATHHRIRIGLSPGLKGQFDTTFDIRFVIHANKKHPTCVER